MTTPQPAALPERIAHVEDWPDDRTPIGLVWDVDPASVPVGTKLYALAALQPQPAAAVSDEQIRHDANLPFVEDEHGSEWATLSPAMFARAVRRVLAQRPQAVPMPEPVQRLSRYAGQTMRTARNPNITAREAIEIGDYLAAIRITDQGAQGGEG